MREVAEMVRIGHLLDKMPSQCSGGESQRVALARTLVTNPSTFLLDEPLSSLDAKLRRELRAECDRLHQALKRTFIYVTHDQEEAMTLADRIVVMRVGRNRAGRLADGDLLKSGQLFRRRFLRLAVDEPGCRRDRAATAASARFRSALLRDRIAGAFQDGKPGTATLGIRPEHVRRRRSAANGDVELPVRLVEPLGKDTLLYFDAGTERAFVAVTEGLDMADIKVGERVALSLDAAPHATCSTREGTADSRIMSAGDARELNMNANRASRNPWTTVKRAKSATACGSTGTCRSRWTTAWCCAATSTGRSPRASIR